MNTNWQKVSQTVELPTYRTGWLGVWDAFVSAVTGSKRIEITREFTLSFFVNKDSFCEVSIQGNDLK